MKTPHRADPLLTAIAERAKLREGPVGVADFMRIVKQADGVPLKQIARQIGLPIPVATAVRRELETEGLLSRGAGVTLTEAGQAFVDEVLDLQAAPAATCETCDGSGLAEPDPQLVEQMQSLLDGAPKVLVELDQAPCTVETALRRAALMHHHGALEGKRILILGDDDSISLAIIIYLAHQGRKGSVSNITVLDVDADRIAFLEDRARTLGADLTIISHDLRDPLPEQLQGSFDVFQTDPPYTVEGARLFLTRAQEALRHGPGALGFLSFGQPATEDQFALLGAIHSLGFAVTAMRRDFNAYEGASILGSTSQMIELEGLFSKPAEKAERYSGLLYTAEKSTRRRGYRCKACGVRMVLGKKGVPSTIEALKAGGCPSCGEKVFYRSSGGS